MMSAWAGLAIGLFVFAGDTVGWPQFRGPDGQGHAKADSLPIEWDERKNVRWKVAISGLGWSSPVANADAIWLTTATGEGASLRAVGVDRNTGKVLHDVEVFAPKSPVRINPKNSFASPTGVLEPGRFYVNFGTMGTACIDVETGRVVWRNEELKLDHMEGPGSSLAPFEDLMILHCDGIDAQFIVALRKSDGRIAWKTRRTGKLRDRVDFHKAYCTPLIVERSGKKILVSPAADNLYTYDPRTGKELGRLSYAGFSNVPRPIEAEGLVFFTTGYMQPQLWAVRIGDDGVLSDDSVEWRLKDQVPANPSPIAVDGRIYFVSDRGIATCVEAKTGKLIWRERLAGSVTASPIHADGKLYFFADDGTGVVVKPGDRLEVLAKNRLPGRIQASPMALDNALFVRTSTHLYRIEQPAK